MQDQKNNDRKDEKSVGIVEVHYLSKNGVQKSCATTCKTLKRLKLRFSCDRQRQKDEKRKYLNKALRFAIKNKML